MKTDYPSKSPMIELFTSTSWKDYELLDSGDGLKLERYGSYRFIRPEHQAVWNPALQQKEWEKAVAVFQPTSDESGGNWHFTKKIDLQWEMHYRELKFIARTSNSRHLGVFPEQATHWDWLSKTITASKSSVNVLNLFGYTGLATLAAAQAGAHVTHLDASKKAISYARENQLLSGLQDKPIRWIIDDAVKFVQREARRGVHYDGIIMDPPKFGRGPKGEVWEFFKMLPYLLQQIKPLFPPQPLFLVITAYAIRASALSLHFAVQELMQSYRGSLSTGELVTHETSAGRILSMAITSRWSAD
ncbi:MAG: SAM-dependent methyltransferase [Anaerolineales bacterium]|nr:class I SAM-dependent rRNA methyltransferase [Anaerolineae bacterium]PWB53045.1 MAG: SAM-dependent methyltransferase [Anaerolineales bacterium]